MLGPPALNLGTGVGGMRGCKGDMLSLALLCTSRTAKQRFQRSPNSRLCKICRESVKNWDKLRAKATAQWL